MSELEDLLRAEVLRRSEEFTPPAGLPDRIEVRARHRYGQRRRRTAGALAAGMAVLVLTVVLVPWDGDDQDDVRVGGDRREATSTTTTEADPTTSSTTAATSSTTASTTPSTTGGGPAHETPSTTGQRADVPDGPLVGPDTPLSRSGVGPITAGMTLREAEAVAGVTITPFTASGGTCTSASIDGTSVEILAERPGASGDPMDSVIRLMSVAVEGRTVEGAAIGDPPSELRTTYGEPTRSAPNGQEGLLVYESGGYAYGFLTNPEQIAVIYAGDPEWVAFTGDPDGCAS